MLDVPVKHITLYFYLKTVASDGRDSISLPLAHHPCTLVNSVAATNKRGNVNVKYITNKP